MAADYSRIHRLLKILTLIQGQTGWSTAKLAAECGVTERTIYRDFEMLEGAGIPYFFDEPTNGYAIRRDFFMPPVSLTLEESLAVVALGEHVGGKELIPFTEPAADAISKIRCNLPAGIQDELGKLDERVTIQLSAVNPPEGIESIYRRMRAAIAERRVLSCRYEAIGRKEGQDDPFDFEPHTLFFGQRAWYAIGRHSRRDGLRCLKLSRFSQCLPTNRTYAFAESFSIQKHLGNAWRMIRGSVSHDVELWFDAEFAETIADTHWHQTQEIEQRADGSILFRCTVDGLDEIVWWVLSMGPHCVVNQPAELADRVRDLAAAVVQRYAR